jgi:hypothetical protein
MNQTGKIADAWRKSTRCEAHSCVEVARRGGAMAIRNSQVPAESLVFADPAWATFIAGVRAGQFEL